MAGRAYSRPVTLEKNAMQEKTGLPLPLSYLLAHLRKQAAQGGTSGLAEGVRPVGRVEGGGWVLVAGKEWLVARGAGAGSAAPALERGRLGR